MMSQACYNLSHIYFVSKLVTFLMAKRRSFVVYFPRKRQNGRPPSVWPLKPLCGRYWPFACLTEGCCFYFSNEEPETPTAVNVTRSEIFLTFKELTDGLKTYFYRVEGTGADGGVHKQDCSISNHSCQLVGLTPARAYTVGLRACFNPLPDKDVCSPIKGTLVIGTLSNGESL